MLGPETFAVTDCVIAIDDELFSRQVLARTLERVGHPRLLQGDSAIAGRELLQRCPAPRLLILDHDMPGETGLELLKAIRCGTTSAARDLPVMILSGIDDEQVVRAAIALDVDAFVAKPLMAEGLRSRLPMILAPNRDVKPQAAYAALATPAGPRMPLPPCRGAIEVKLEELRVFQTLGADIHSAAGTLVASQGTIVSSRLLSVLHDIHAAGMKLSPVYLQPPRLAPSLAPPSRTGQPARMMRPGS